MVFLFHRLIYKEGARPTKASIRPIISLGLIQTSIQYFFFYIGVANTSGIKSSILQSSSTFFTVILAHFIYKEDKLDMKKILSLALGFAGVVLVNINKEFDLSFKFIGEGFLIISSLLGAFATIYAKKISEVESNPFVLSGGQMLVGSLVLLVFGLLAGGSLVFTLKSFLLLLYAAFISAAAFTLWYMLLQYNSPGKISIYRLFIPIFGASFSAILLPDEGFSLNLLLGLALVVLGIGVLNLNEKEA